MKAHRPCWPRQFGHCLAVPAVIVLLAVLAPLPVLAQGTPQQRAACESEARWLCSNYIPDENAIKACLLRNLKSLSPACRALFRGKRRR
jgi:hypothetical protein